MQYWTPPAAFSFSVCSELVPSRQCEGFLTEEERGLLVVRPLGAWLLPVIREPGRRREASSDLGSEAGKLRSRWGQSRRGRVGGAVSSQRRRGLGGANSRDPGTLSPGQPATACHVRNMSAGYRRLDL